MMATKRFRDRPIDWGLAAFVVAGYAFGIYAVGWMARSAGYPAWWETIGF